MAYLPTFYRDEDAMFRAIKTLNECTNDFKNQYNNFRSSFIVVYKEGKIRNDFGEATLINNYSEFTSIGGGLYIHAIRGNCW